MKALKYTAVYMTGSVLGVVASKVLGRKPEFLADRFAKTHVGVEPTIAALTKIHARTEEIIKSGEVPKRLVAFMKLMDYHPKLSTRVEALR